MPMDVLPRQQGFPSSALNPNAPMFVPSAYRNVEDFSDQWWSLVRSSPSFRDYWLRECFSDSLFDLNDCSDPFFPDDCDDEFIDFDNTKINRSQDEEKEVRKDMMLVRLCNWRKARGADAPRLYEKAPKIVNVKVNPRPIHQPR